MASNILRMKPLWLNKHVWTIRRDNAYFGMHTDISNCKDGLLQADRSKIYIFRTKKKAEEFATTFAGVNGSGLLSLKFARREGVDWNVIQTYELAEVTISKEELTSLKRTAKIAGVELSVFDSVEDGRTCRNNYEVNMTDTREFLNELMALK